MQFFSRNNDKKEDGQDSEAPPVRLATPVASIPPVATSPAPHPTVPVPPKASVVTGPPTLTEDGTLDFPAIYQFARVASTSFTAEQTLSMLEQLPAAMPLEMKRQTVQVTLTALGTAIGANRQSIVGDADQKRSTLQKYADAQGGDAGADRRTPATDHRKRRSNYSDKGQARARPNSLRYRGWTLGECPELLRARNVCPARSHAGYESDAGE